MNDDAKSKEKTEENDAQYSANEEVSTNEEQLRQDDESNEQACAAPTEPSPQEEADKWKDVALRTAAEMENMRKRAARDREDAIKYANQRLLEDLLPIIDNFEMGLQAAAQDSSSMIYVGMAMVKRQLDDFLTSQGAEEIPSDSEFNPNLHEAIAQEVSADVPEGHIIRVAAKGYKIAQRLLRPTKVVVAKAQDNTETSN